MAYVGTPIDTRNTFQSLQGKRFNGDGSTTAFTLDVAPSSTLDIEVFVGNVRQDPNSAYTLSGTTLTFTGAPPSGTNNIYVVHQAKAVGTITPGVNTVTNDMLVGSIANAKLANSSISINGSSVSLGGSLTTSAGTESFLAYNGANYNSSHNASTLVQVDTELYDTDNRFTNTSSNYKYTVANAGKYFFFGNVQVSATSSQTLNQAFLNIYKNGSSIAQVGINYSGDYSDVTQLHITVSDDASASDYYQLYNYAVSSGGADMTVGGGNRGNTYFGGFRLA